MDPIKVRPLSFRSKENISPDERLTFVARQGGTPGSLPKKITSTSTIWFRKDNHPTKLDFKVLEFMFWAKEPAYSERNLGVRTLREGTSWRDYKMQRALARNEAMADLAF